MAGERVQRKLAAILAADAVGYSRLMSKDETGTRARFNAHLNDLIEPAIAGRRGRIVKTIGDGLLVEFSSVVDAVQCAIEIQQGMAARNSEEPEDRRIAFRIGINLGDVIIEDDDLFGDGVNVAARLEGKADPGAVLISDSVMRQARGKVSEPFADVGEISLKNIDTSVRAWQWSIDGRPSPQMFGGALTRLSRTSSIAVLPFKNLTNDPEQDYFGDGIVEDIITALSRFTQLFVVARNSTFTYKGRSVDVRQIAADLGVTYVLEGSFRKSGARVRVTSQLIHAETGGHAWAGKFDGELEDIFDLQDQMTEAVVAAIEPAIRKADLQLARRKPPENLDAYDRYLQALPLVYSLHRESAAKAFEILEEAVALDSNYSSILALSAWCLEQGIVRGWPQQTGDDRALCIERATAALSLDSDDANAIAVAGFALQMVSPEFDAGSAVVDRALALNPNSEIAVVFCGLICIFAGDVDRARGCFEKALALNPADAGNTIPYFGIAASHFSRGDYEQACRFGTKSAALNPKRESIYWILSAAYGLLGQETNAQKAIERLISLNPKASQSLFHRALPFRNEVVKSAMLRGMQLAGLPD